MGRGAPGSRESGCPAGMPLTVGNTESRARPPVSLPRQADPSSAGQHFAVKDYHGRRTSSGTAEPDMRRERLGGAFHGSGRRGLPRAKLRNETVWRSQNRGLLRLRCRGQRTLMLSSHAFTFVRDHFPAKGMHNSG